MVPESPRKAPLFRSAGADNGRTNEGLIAIFCLGVALFNPLVIGLLDRGSAVTVLGMPLLYFYFFAAWALLIALLAWVIDGARRVRQGDAKDDRVGANEVGVGDR